MMVQFNTEQQQLFKEATARAINAHCITESKCEFFKTGEMYIIRVSFTDN